MANMLDYLVWRGDIPLSVVPWGGVDGLICAQFSYLDFHGGQNTKGWTLEELNRIDALQEGTSNSFAGRKAVFQKMAESARFSGTRMHHAIALTDPEIEMQFSAMCLDLPDGTTCVAFRGTDNTIVGWREDFNMAYQTRVPAQEAATLYLTRAAGLSDRPLRIVGHSKGGNLAVYASACVSKKIQKRIESIWSYDGPGMNREMSQTEGFGRIRERIHSYVPQTSIIGMLMDYYEPYTVVHSTASGISQHDPMTWQIYGPQFVTRPSVDQTAKVTRDTLHNWLQNSTPEQRADFVDVLFRLVDTTKATRMSDLTGEKFRSLLTMVGNRKEVNPEARRVFNRLMAQAVTLGFGNVIDRVRGRKDEGGGDGVSNEWMTMSPEKRMEMKAARTGQGTQEKPAEGPAEEKPADEIPTEPPQPAEENGENGENEG
ncbi:MAG: Mbeg1-like protein [Eubacteriales bacterium]